MIKKKISKTFKNLRKKAVAKIGESSSLSKNLPSSIYNLLHEIDLYQTELEIQNEELKKNINDAEASHSRYQELYEDSPINYFVLDHHNIIIDVNAAAAQLLGLEKKFILNRGFFSFLDKKSHLVFYKNRQLTWLTKRKQVFEIKLKKHQADIDVLCESVCINSQHKNNKIIRLSVIDISEFKKTTLALNQSEEKYKFFVDNTKDWICIINHKKIFVYSNEAIKWILGYTQKEIIGKNYTMFIPIENLSLDQKDEKNISLPLQHKDGTLRHVEIRIRPYINQIDMNEGYWATIRDVTWQKQVEANKNLQLTQLNKAERVSYLGELISNLAHELAQPLTSITNYATGCAHYIDRGIKKSELLKVMEKIVFQSERAGKVIHSIKQFLKNGKLNLEIVEIHALIRNTVDLVTEESIKKQVKIHLKLMPAELYISADRIQISLVLLNLIHNSLDSIMSANRAEKQIIISTHFLSNDAVKICVMDTGLGIDKCITEKIFDMWFTTKDTGLGLGLSISKNIIEAHGGELSAVECNQGAQLEFILPIKQEQCV